MPYAFYMSCLLMLRASRPSICHYKKWRMHITPVHLSRWWVVITQCNKKWKWAYDRIVQCFGYLHGKANLYHSILWSQILLKKTSGVWEKVEFSTSMVISAYSGLHVVLSQHLHLLVIIIIIIIISYCCYNVSTLQFLDE